jgi:type IV secretion system protein TrbL
MDGASTSEFFKNPGSAFALVFAALLIVVSYTIIAINFIVTIVESYLVVSVGFIFLGFGGSRWTVPYTERYIGLAVSIGMKILLLYCLISAGMGLGVGWATEAQGVGTSPRPAMTAFDVMGAAVIFMMLCWQIPKLFSAVLGGAPALAGGDLISTGTGMIAGSAMVASFGAEGAALGARGLAALSGVAAAAGNGGGPSGASGPGVLTTVGPIPRDGSGGGAANSVAPPPTPTPSASSGGRASQPDPPFGGTGVDSVNLAAVGFTSNRGSSPSNTGVIDTPVASNRNGTNSNPAAGATGVTGVGAPAMSAERALSGVASRLNSMRRQFRVIPSDSAAHSTPPRMPIDHQE